MQIGTDAVARRNFQNRMVENRLTPSQRRRCFWGIMEPTTDSRNLSERVRLECLTYVSRPVFRSTFEQ